MPRTDSETTSPEHLAVLSLVLNPPRDLLALAGPDRLRFLHGLVTCDIKSLTPGAGSYGFFTTGQGKVLCDFSVLAFEDRLWLELPAGQGEGIASHLSKYLIADRVEISLLVGMSALVLVGKEIAQVVPEVGELPAAPWSHGRRSLEGVEVVVARRELMGAPALTMYVPSESIAEVSARLARSGVQAADPDALERLRVLAGIPRFGVDFSSEHFPQETGLESAAVSYTKGCYLGQEVVARIHYRGGVQRSLRGLRLAAVVAPGAVVLAEEREAGRVGSVIADPRGTGWLALAVLHKRAWAPTAAGAVAVEAAAGSVAAEVVDLPFA